METLDKVKAGQSVTVRKIRATPGKEATDGYEG